MKTLSRPSALACAILIILLILPFIAEVADTPFYIDLAIKAMLLALAATSLNMIMGLAGLVSLGHAAFLGLGAYSVGILAEIGIESAYVQWPLAMLLSGLFAAIVGVLSLRTQGLYFLMITLAFAQMLFFLFVSLEQFGGDDGMTLWSRSDFGSLLDISNQNYFYYLCLAILSLALVFFAAMMRSRFGRVLTGIRLNEQRMRMIGYNTFGYKLAAFILAGMICGLAGALQANLIEYISPSFMSWHRSGELIFIVVLGGLGTLFGPLFGSVAFVVLEEVFSQWTDQWLIVMGPILVMVALFSQGGIEALVSRKDRRK